MNYKKQSKTLKEELKSKNINLGMRECQDIIARINGFRSRTAMLNQKDEIKEECTVGYKYDCPNCKNNIAGIGGYTQVINPTYLTCDSCGFSGDSSEFECNTYKIKEPKPTTKIINRVSQEMATRLKSLGFSQADSNYYWINQLDSNENPYKLIDRNDPTYIEDIFTDSQETYAAPLSKDAKKWLRDNKKCELCCNDFLKEDSIIRTYMSKRNGDTISSSGHYDEEGTFDPDEEISLPRGFDLLDDSDVCENCGCST